LMAGPKARRNALRIRRPSHATFVAYLALFTALGGGAYAATQISSLDIENGTIKSVDLANREAVGPIDVRRNALTGREINEAKLDASRFARVTGSQSSGCDPVGSGVFATCASATLNLARRSRILAIATAGQQSVGGPASATCEVRIDDAPASSSALPGEASTDNTSGTATDGFARTIVTPTPLTAGAHSVSLACSELAGNVRIERPTIAAIAITAR
jgi:hypothetical protein